MACADTMRAVENHPRDFERIAVRG